MTGLPPAPEDVESFVQDDSPEAFAKVVDRLLDSPRYGERWARHWLDLARYSDSEGFKSDETRPNAWRYRDYVINALNDDKPYDRFLRGANRRRRALARRHLGAHRHGFQPPLPRRDQPNGICGCGDRKSFLTSPTRWEQPSWASPTAAPNATTTSSTRCCKPSYYRLQAFFANSKANDHISLWSDKEVADYESRLQAWEDKTRDIRDRMEVMLAPARQEILEDRFSRYYPGIREQLAKPPEEQTPYERQMYAKYKWQMEFSSPRAGRRCQAR